MVSILPSPAPSVRAVAPSSTAVAHAVSVLTHTNPCTSLQIRSTVGVDVSGPSTARPARSGHFQFPLASYCPGISFRGCSACVPTVSHSPGAAAARGGSACVPTGSHSPGAATSRGGSASAPAGRSPPRAASSRGGSACAPAGSHSPGAAVSRGGSACAPAGSYQPRGATSQGGSACASAGSHSPGAPASRGGSTAPWNGSMRFTLPAPPPKTTTARGGIEGIRQTLPGRLSCNQPCNAATFETRFVGPCATGRNSIQGISFRHSSPRPSPNFRDREIHRITTDAMQSPSTAFKKQAWADMDSRGQLEHSKNIAMDENPGDALRRLSPKRLSRSVGYQEINNAGTDAAQSRNIIVKNRGQQGPVGTEEKSVERLESLSPKQSTRCVPRLEAWSPEITKVGTETAPFPILTTQGQGEPYKGSPGQQENCNSCVNGGDPVEVTTSSEKYVAEQTQSVRKEFADSELVNTRRTGVVRFSLPVEMLVAKAQCNAEEGEATELPINAPDKAKNQYHKIEADTFVTRFKQLCEAELQKSAA